MKNLIFVLKLSFSYMLLSVACILILRTIVGYMSLEDDVQFLAFKQEYIGNFVWKASFYLHTFSAVFVLFAGFTQFSSDLLRENRVLHKFLGRLYVFNILVINFPAAMIMAVYANGGVLAKTAFVLLDLLWFYFTYVAFISARNKDFVKHKHYMMRSYALTLSAITLRTWKIILSTLFSIDPDRLYVIDAWMGFVPNLLLAEYMVRSMVNAGARR